MLAAKDIVDAMCNWLSYMMVVDLWNLLIIVLKFIKFWELAENPPVVAFVLNDTAEQEENITAIPNYMENYDNKKLIWKHQTVTATTAKD